MNSTRSAGSFEMVCKCRPFTDGEYVKSCTFNIARELFDEFPNKENLAANSRRVVVGKNSHERAVKMANPIDK